MKRKLVQQSNIATLFQKQTKKQKGKILLSLSNGVCENVYSQTRLIEMIDCCYC